MKLIEVNFYAHNECNTPEEVLNLYKPSSGFIEFIKNKLDIQRIHHINASADVWINEVRHLFFKSVNKPWFVPYQTLLYIKKERPDFILVHGIVFQIQVIALKLFIGSKCKIICQHHGEKPCKGIRRFFQKIADECITAYLFTSKKIAVDWIESGQIANAAKCFEVLEASVSLAKRDRKICKNDLGMEGNLNFLWVGRLVPGKDPLTILSGFEALCKLRSDARLYMIFQKDDMLEAVRNKISQTEILKKAVHLVGFVPSTEIEKWYNASDFYISGSHHEGCGYALLEAMACGCIPIVTRIPAFEKVTNNGEYGLLFEVGKKESLIAQLFNLTNINHDHCSQKIAEYFQSNLSYQNIADDIYSICKNLKHQ